MASSKTSPGKSKKIKKLLSLMNKQNQRFLPTAPPLVEMVDMTTTDEELDILLGMGTGYFDYQQARKTGDIPDDRFQTVFDTVKRKGLLHTEYDQAGNEKYRLNAVAVGWYEAMVHYLVGKPQEKEFSRKWNEYFLFFKKFNIPPLRQAQNLFLRNFLKPTQDMEIMDPVIEGKTKTKTIPINASVPYSASNVYPTFQVNDIVEEFGDRDDIYAFPCVCRHGNRLIDSPCGFEMPKESCMGFGDIGRAWASFDYGRRISKEEAVDILVEVRENGAVHSVFHERDDHRLPVMAICNCCWDCCGILKPYNMAALPLMYRSSFVARFKDDADCKGCGNCEKYCPTTAVKLRDKKAVLNPDMCIGCGQCAFQCRQNNIELCADERTVYLPILKKSEARVTV